MNVGFISLGCSKNLIDTEITIGKFKEHNYKVVNDEEKADLLVINTCGFIDSAKEEAINTILEMAEYKNRRCKYLIVIGCLVQRYYDELVKLLPEVDLWIKLDEYDILWEKIEDLVKRDIVEKSKGFVQNILPDSSFIPGDIETIELSTEFDLIVSNASMQWICDIDTLFNKLKSALKPDGVLAFTTFGEKNYREIKETTGLALNYLKTDTLAQLCEKYFRMEYLEEKTETLLFDSPMDILKHIKDSGTNGIQTINWTVKKLRDFERFYTLKFNENEKVRLTYNPIYVILKNNK